MSPINYTDSEEDLTSSWDSEFTSECYSAWSDFNDFPEEEVWRPRRKPVYDLPPGAEEHQWADSGPRMTAAERARANAYKDRKDDWDDYITAAELMTVRQEELDALQRDAELDCLGASDEKMRGKPADELKELLLGDVWFQESQKPWKYLKRPDWFMHYCGKHPATWESALDFRLRQDNLKEHMRKVSDMFLLEPTLKLIAQLQDPSIPLGVEESPGFYTKDSKRYFHRQWQVKCNKRALPQPNHEFPGLTVNWGFDPQLFPAALMLRMHPAYKGYQKAMDLANDKKHSTKKVALQWLKRNAASVRRHHHDEEFLEIMGCKIIEAEFNSLTECKRWLRNKGF